MWIYAVALLALAVIAEVLGLGGIPAPGVEFENLLFIVLILTLIGMALKKYASR